MGEWFSTDLDSAFDGFVDTLSQKADQASEWVSETIEDVKTDAAELAEEVAQEYSEFVGASEEESPEVVASSQSASNSAAAKLQCDPEHYTSQIQSSSEPQEAPAVEENNEPNMSQEVDPELLQSSTDAEIIKRQAEVSAEQDEDVADAAQQALAWRVQSEGDTQILADLQGKLDDEELSDEVKEVIAANVVAALSDSGEMSEEAQVASNDILESAARYVSEEDIETARLVIASVGNDDSGNGVVAAEEIVEESSPESVVAESVTENVEELMVPEAEEVMGGANSGAVESVATNEGAIEDIPVNPAEETGTDRVAAQSAQGADLVLNDANENADIDVNPVVTVAAMSTDAIEIADSAEPSACTGIVDGAMAFFGQIGDAIGFIESDAPKTGAEILVAGQSANENFANVIKNGDTTEGAVKGVTMLTEEKTVAASHTAPVVATTATSAEVAGVASVEDNPFSSFGRGLRDGLASVVGLFKDAEGEGVEDGTSAAATLQFAGMAAINAAGLRQGVTATPNYATNNRAADSAHQIANAAGKRNQGDDTTDDQRRRRDDDADYELAEEDGDFEDSLIPSTIGQRNPAPAPQWA